MDDDSGKPPNHLSKTILAFPGHGDATAGPSSISSARTRLLYVFGYGSTGVRCCGGMNIPLLRGHTVHFVFAHNSDTFYSTYKLIFTHVLQNYFLTVQVR